MAAPAQKFAFRGNSRQRIQRVGNYVVQLAPGNNRLSIELPRVGYLAGLLVQVGGFLSRTAGDSGAFSTQYFNIVNRLQLNLNIGASQIFDVSGHGTNLLNQAMSFNYAADLGGHGAPGAPLLPFADPAVWDGVDTIPQTNQDLIFTYWIPIAMNDGLNFNVGLINLQAPEIRATLDITMGALADLFVPGAVLTGTSVTAFGGAAGQMLAQVSYLYYEVPNPDLVQIPPYIVHRVIQERQAIQATGDQLYTVPRMGQLQRLIHSVQINGVLDGANVNDLVIRVNKTDEIYRMANSVNRWLSRMRYGHTVPQAAFYHDWWRAADLNAAGDFRDVIDSEQISTLESIVSIDPTTVLGVGNNFLDSIREFTQRLA
jgi:hypothetical protein